jgi:hypothetical protein
MKNTNISNTDEIIDSRDVIARIEELEEEQTRLEDAEDGPFPEDDAQELAALKALANQGGYIGDWKYGATLINDDYFEEYARELAEDIGAISDDAKWPATCIDWGKAANELKMDYTSIDFAGSTYWVR